MRREMIFYRGVAIVLTVVLALMLCFLVYDFGRKSALTPSSSSPAGAAAPAQATVQQPASVELACDRLLTDKAASEAKGRRASTEQKGFRCLLPASELATAVAAATSAPTRDEPPRSIDSSINVVAIVIAMVTLILTVGTSWFSQKQIEIATMMKELDQRRALAELLVYARVDVVKGLSQSLPASGIVATHGQLVAALLELLSSPIAEKRQRAYLEIKPFFGAGVVADYPNLLRYTNACSKLVPHGEPTWCDLFDIE